MEYRSVRIKDVISGINKDYFLPAIQRAARTPNRRHVKRYQRGAVSLMSHAPPSSRGTGEGMRTTPLRGEGRATARPIWVPAHGGA